MYNQSSSIDGKFETLLMGDDLGICHKYDFTEENWHTCEFKKGTSDPNPCHEKEIEEEYLKKIDEEFKKQENEKKKNMKKLDKDNKSNMNLTADQKLKHLGNSKKPIAYAKKENGIIKMQRMIHKGWITKIKYYPELNYIISSSLDGFIHIHEIEKLEYKEGKTFNLH